MIWKVVDATIILIDKFTKSSQKRESQLFRAILYLSYLGKTSNVELFKFLY